MKRRLCLQALPGLALAPWLRTAAAAAQPIAGITRRALVFPLDHGSHPEARTEWWYVTGVLHLEGATAEFGAGPSQAELGPSRRAAAVPGGRVPTLFGFQVTFFRSRTEVPADHPSRFAAHQVLFAHAALSDLPQRRLRHDQRIARSGFGIAEAAIDDTRVKLRDWRFERSGPEAASVYRAQVASDDAGFALDLQMAATQPVMLQGDQGYSRKGPLETQASHYYSQPQLRVGGTLLRDGQRLAVGGRAWLDHEWSSTYMPPEAVGWDWIGINLDDGGALMAFRMRRADGSALWSAGSLRAADGTQRVFEGADALRFTPGRRWTSPATGASYPVQWQIDTPAGRYEVRALLDAQELDSRGSTGSIYWEGLSELVDAGSGRRLGTGYLEMTGYAGAQHV